MAVAPVGLLVIRAWVQEGSERPLRVEVRLTADTGRGFERELAFSEPAPVQALVRAWLEQVLAGPADRSPSDGRPERGGHAAVTPRSRPLAMIASIGRGGAGPGHGSAGGRRSPTTVRRP